MFDVEVGGIIYRESDAEAPGDEVVRRRRRRAASSGMTVCYDLRFPELFRILAVRGARVDRAAGRVHACHTGQGPLGGAGARARDREPGLHDRRRADRHASARSRELRPLDDRRSRGESRSRSRAGRASASSRPTSTSTPRSAIREKLPSLANRQPHAYRWPELQWRRRHVSARKQDEPVDKRRVILDAAITRVRARGIPPLPRVRHRARGERRLRPRLPLLPLQGRGARTRSSPSAGACCSRRSSEVDRQDVPVRDKLYAIAVLHHRVLPATTRT